GLEQRLAILGPIVRTADGIKLEGPIRNAQTVKQRRQQFQQFGVARGRLATRGRRTNNLSADLIELPVASLLWALAAKLGADIVELVQPTFPKLVLDVGSDDAGSVFGAKGKGLRPVFNRHGFDDDLSFLQHYLKILRHCLRRDQPELKLAACLVP